ncbi:MAG: hypothetical protein AVDCRST_MAG10-276, partial [uncultured Acidimicrobiales bacterium]
WPMRTRCPRLRAASLSGRNVGRCSSSSPWSCRCSWLWSWASTPADWPIPTRSRWSKRYGRGPATAPACRSAPIRSPPGRPVCATGWCPRPAARWRSPTCASSSSCPPVGRTAGSPTRPERRTSRRSTSSRSRPPSRPRSSSSSTRRSRCSADRSWPGSSGTRD